MLLFGRFVPQIGRAATSVTTGLGNTSSAQAVQAVEARMAVARRQSHHLANKGFTLVEVICVIGVIGILIALLMPSLIKARQAAMTLKCLSTLRGLGVAFHSYAAEQKGYVPYPTSLLYPPPSDQRFLWFNAVDQYLAANDKAQANRTGIAATRNYKPYKQCWVWETFEGDRDSGEQSPTKEMARTYKMNTHLRHPDPPTHAKMTDVNESSSFVLLGDAVSLDSS